MQRNPSVKSDKITIVRPELVEGRVRIGRISIHGSTSSPRTERFPRFNEGLQCSRDSLLYESSLPALSLSGMLLALDPKGVRTTMGIQCIKFTHPITGRNLSQLSLEVERAQDLEKLPEDGVRIALLLRNSDLGPFRLFIDLVVDRGKKDRRKALSWYLLGKGRSRVPLVEGAYTSASQLKRSMRELLENAAGTNDSRVFLVGAGNDVFEALWDKAGTPGGKRTSDRGKQESLAESPDETAEGFYEELRSHCKTAPEKAAGFVGSSREADHIRTLIVVAAQNTAPVLITGETGTGKEVVAREIHRCSSRMNASFIAVNCGAIPSELFESELFGHKRGAFTGAAYEKEGLWKAADHGTLFLDEIGELLPQHQAKILRALEMGKIRPIGSKEEISVDAHVLAATNRDLAGMVAAGRFREDLYYRLRGFIIQTHPLREHPEDIPPIAQALWKEIAGDGAKPLPDEIVEHLRAGSWPGNARELKATLRQLHNFFPGAALRAKHLHMVLHHFDQGKACAREIADECEVERFRGECLLQLRRAMDVIQGVKFALSPLDEAGKMSAKQTAAIRTTLGLNLDTLERLCEKPLAFGSEPTFAAISRFKEKLGTLVGLLRADLADAKRYRAEVFAEECATAMSAVFKAVEKVQAC